MANTLTVQRLVDGAKNVVIKVDGNCDTSDLSATGTLGTAGVTTTGSTTLTFTAGALAPVVGNLITGSAGTGTGIPANAYITSIISATSVTINVPVVTGGTSWTFTITAGNVVLLDPLQLAVMDNNNVLATKLRIDKIVYDVEDLQSVNLFWDATTPTQIWHLVGRGKLEFDRKYGGLQNNAGTGITGRILLATQGWSAAASLSYSFVMECTKQTVTPM